jgi:hypothetical protein
MKIRTLLSLAFAMVGLFVMASPAEAQHHGHSGGNYTGGAGFAHHGDYGHHGDFGHGGHYYGHGYGYGRGHVNVYFGGFGYPYYGDPFFGYPYGYAYGYAPYGYGYYGAPVASYSYDPQGVYMGRVVSRGGRQLSTAAQVQEQLAQAGYYHGAIDGVVGDGTRRAIRNYERANDLRVGGSINGELLASMGLR